MHPAAVVNERNTSNIDAYTGREIEGNRNVDHIVSAKEVHGNSRAHLFLSEEQRAAMVNDDSNLAVTSESINKSKVSKKMSDFVDGQASGAPDGITNADRFDIDRERTAELDRQSRDQMKKKMLGEQVKKQGKELLQTGAAQGLKLGAMQAFGLMLREFVEASFSEIRSFLADRKAQREMTRSMLQELKERLSRIAQRVMSKWKEALVSFRDGVVSGFLANLITFLINNFATTLKNVVTLIREAISSITSAVRTIAAGTKILLTGMTACLGIALLEAVKNFLASFPPLLPFADGLAAVITGIVTGVTTVLVLYAFDKMKERIELHHAGIVAANQYALLNKYQALQTVALLDEGRKLTESAILQSRELERRRSERRAAHDSEAEDAMDDINRLLRQLPYDKES